MTTITAVIREVSTPLPPASPWPLLYTVDVEDPEDNAEIARVVALIRYEEIIGKWRTNAADTALRDLEVQRLEEIQAGIEVLFTFEGDVKTLSDFRA